jgi:hypothetical protein
MFSHGCSADTLACLDGNVRKTFAFALLLKDSGQLAKAFDDLKFPPKRKPVEFAVLLETAAFPRG